MKKILFITMTLFTVLILGACTNNEEKNEMIPLSTSESLASLSYLSTSFLDATNNAENLSRNILVKNMADEETIIIEEELDEVNVYMDKLKSFIDNGTKEFANVDNSESEKTEYQSKMSFTVSNETYILYYNENQETKEITGIFVIGEVEYDIEVINSLESEKESVNMMQLLATNGNDTVKIVYNKSEESDQFIKFHIEENISGITSTVDMKITREEYKYKVSVEDETGKYVFKTSTEDDNANYRLEYEVDGTKGFVMILEKTNELGEKTYEYKIHENGKQKSVEKGKPNSKGFGERAKGRDKI